LAIWLLRDRIRTDSELRTAIADKWIDAITGRFNNGEDHHQEMVALAYALNPGRCIQSLLREIKDDDERHGQILALRSYERCWDERLTKTLVALITANQLKPSSVESALVFLSSVDPQAATECVKILLPNGVERDSSTIERTKGVLCFALGRLPAATWESAWPLLNSNSDLAADILPRVVDGIEYPSKNSLPQLSEAHLADLYMLVNRVFPPDEDPGFTGGEVTPRRRIVNFKGGIIGALTARGTEQACRELLRLCEMIPKQRIWLRQRYVEASRSKRRKAWQPLPPQSLLKLVRNSISRMLESEADLVEVILESLQRFQACLTKNSPPEAAFLWNYEGSGNRRHNFRPKDEEDLSDRIALWLKNDIGPKSHVVVGREVQPRRGTKADIIVTAYPTSPLRAESTPLTVVIEVKGCWNREVKTAIKSQLVEDYLDKNGWTHGVYLVGWFLCDRWDAPTPKLKSCLSGKTFEDATLEIQDLASSYDGRNSFAIVAGFCLDCRFPV